MQVIIILYSSLHPTPFPLWMGGWKNEVERMNTWAAQMIIVGWLIITRAPPFLPPSILKAAICFSLLSHTFDWASTCSLSYTHHSLYHSHCTCSSVHLQTCNLTHTPPFFIAQTHTCCNCRRSGNSLCTVESWFQDIMVVQGEEVVLVQGQGKESSAESWLGLGGLGVPGLPSLSLVAKYSCVLCWTPREKSSVEEEIKEKEEAISQRSSEVQVKSRCLRLSVSLSLFPVQWTPRERGIYRQTGSMA